ncbi:MAG: haloacid dehalogenase-like hydrolase [Cellulosilyticaceae bacterium]
MNSRRFLAILALACMSVGIFIGCGNKTSINTEQSVTTGEKNKAGEETSKLRKLEKLNWADNTYEQLNKLIEKNGITSPNYNASKKPYIVVDWDNTSIFNDVEEALLIYQLENLEFKTNPQTFSEVIRKNVPTDNFKEEFNNKAGKAININLIAEDIESDYRYIYENYQGMQGTKTLDEMKETLEYKDFVAKVRYLYAAIGSTFSADISYPWVTYLFTGMTEQEVKAFAERGIDDALKQPIEAATATSPEGLQGKAGVVSVTYNKGIRMLPEQQDLYNTLMENGIDVYVCSASFVDVIKTFASNSKYGYNIPEEKIMAMELQRDPQGVILPQFRDGYDQTQGKGKTLTIDRFLKTEKGYGPILVAGDSAGDVAMLEDYDDMQLGLLVNRLKGDDVGKISKIASETIGKEDTKYVLQGRDENAGTFRNSESSILYGEKEEKLLK